MAKGLLSRAVREAVEGDDALAECLARGVANLSAMARHIRPSLEARLGQRVKLQSVVSALKRLRGAYAERERGHLSVLAKSSLDVRTDLAKLSVRAQAALSEELQAKLLRHYRSILQISWGPTALTLVLEGAAFRVLRALFAKEDVLEAKEGLAAVVVRSPKDIIETPGCIAALTERLARGGTNLEDIISTYTDTILVVSMSGVVRAFTLLSELIAGARRALEERHA